MITKTHGIVLRTYPYSETSCVVVWLARDAGRLTTLAKGALRPKSSALGQFDLYYTCELLYYQKDSRDLHILRECSPLTLRSRFRHDWRACASASYLAGLIYRICPPHAVQPGIFSFFENLLDILNTDGGHPALLYWAELQVLQQLGHAPRLDRCLGCKQSLENLLSSAKFIVDRGGYLCRDCLRQGGNHDGHDVGPDVLATLYAWQRSRTARMPTVTRYTKEQGQTMQALLGEFLTHHLELPLAGRNLAMHLLATPPRHHPSPSI